MLETHPSHDRLEQFMRGGLPVADNRTVFGHLIGGCSECREVAATHWPINRDQTLGHEDYELAFFKASLMVTGSAKSLTREKRLAGPLWDELAKHPLPRQLMIVHNSRRFHTWALCERVVEAAKTMVYESPQRAIDTGRLGLAISKQLRAATYGPELLNDLQARACAILGHAYRHNDDWNHASRYFAQAEDHLELGTGDPLEAALLLGMRAQFCGAQRRFQEALALFAKAIRLFDSVGDRHNVGCQMIGQSNIHAESGDLDTSIHLLQRALAYLDTEVDPRRALIAKHNLVISLQETGRLEEAVALLEEIRPMYHKLGDRLNLIRLEWVEAQIARAQGQALSAEQTFQRVRSAFADRNLAYDAALVSLELASLYLEDGRAAQAKGLVTEMLTVFAALGIHREAVAAVMVLQQAIEMKSATVQLVTAVAQFIEQSRLDPGLVFRSAAPHGS